MNPKHQLLGVFTFIENAFQFYKANFKKLWPLFLFGSLNTFSFSFRGNSSSGVSSYLATIPMWIIVVGVILLVVVLFFLFLSKIALFKSITDIRSGQFVGVGNGYKKAIGLFIPYIVITVVIVLSTIGATLFLVIPGIILYGYLYFAQYEFFAQNKKGFDALTSSWALVRNYWWSLAWRIFVVALIIGLITCGIVLAYIIMCALVVLLFAILLHSTIAAIVFGIIAGIVLILFAVLVASPIVVLSVFEVYYHIREVRTADQLKDEVTDKKRTNKIIALFILGLILVIAEIFVSFWAARYLSTLAAERQPSRVTTSYSTGYSEGSVPSTFSFPASSSPVSTALQTTPYISDDGTFKINLPVSWSFVSATSTVATGGISEKITSFAYDKGQSNITISGIDADGVRNLAPGVSDDDITTKLAEGGVQGIKNKMTQMGLKGFGTSDLKMQAFGSDTAYVYRGSASYGAPDYVTYDFELVTIFSKNHAYELLAIWPESEYQWAGKPILDSLATFTLSK